MQAIFLTELSNPPMHVRHLLRLSGRTYTKAYEFVELIFICLYVYARFIAIGPIIYKTLMCQSNHIMVKLCCIGLFLQSLFFITQMKKTLMRRYKEVLARKDHIKLNWITPLNKLELAELQVIYNKKAQINKHAKIGI
jgi:hypothetical protein